MVNIQRLQILDQIIDNEEQRKRYLQNFKNEEVTDADLPNLSDEHLKVLFDKMGPKIRFGKWLKDEYSNKNKTDTNFMSGLL